MRNGRFKLAAALMLLGLAVGCGKFFISGHSLAAISLSPLNPAITLQTSSGTASTQQFTATGTFGDLTTKDISSSATWTSSSPDVATIDSKGLATAVNLGTTTIKASSGGLNASTVLTVSNTVATAIALTCNGLGCSGSGATLTTGTTINLSATATFSDKTTQNVTNSATWATSNANVATVNNQGVVTAISPGSANITASFQGQTSPAFSVSVIF